MGRKSVLPYKLASDQSLAADFTTAPTVIDWLDNCSYQISVTTSDSVGTFHVQASNDYKTSLPSGTVVDQGHWFDLALSGTPSVAGADDEIGIDLRQLPFAAIRLKYVAGTPGTGTCDIFVTAKMIGG